LTDSERSIWAAAFVLALRDGKNRNLSAIEAASAVFCARKCDVGEMDDQSAEMLRDMLEEEE
jgi:prephenate dehydrogenase